MIAKKQKPTLAQLQKKISNAIVFIEKDPKTYNSIYFDDRGLTLEATDDYAIVGRLSFRMVFNSIVSGGYSRVHLVVQKIIEMAHSYGCKVEKNGTFINSYWKLWENISTSDKDEKEKLEDLSILSMFSSWIDVQQCTIFSLSERTQDVFTLQFAHRAFALFFGILSKPYDKDMTNVDLMKEFDKELKSFIKENKETFVVLKKETEEQRKEAIANAMEQNDIEENNNDEEENNNNQK